jgi:hypothetical protein
MPYVVPNEHGCARAPNDGYRRNGRGGSVDSFSDSGTVSYSEGP